ncbi:BTAD domain-containing putative transcriptional regulator [Phytoactinopolyspora limicola]|uniref:BTAD domain-containing putative transcriptional regulator n=1 Tax=Phytoactinopolyspora limicola TaxID=2715536 RepID=UPI0014098560|nr:BTAD domain-containing putative transcriptional regulator [Phytoactinopolyspora limicola]
MWFGVLGPLEVWTADGRPVRVPERKVRTLLADLLVHEGKPAPVHRLVEDLWGQDAPGKPVGALRAKVSLLRRALDDAEPGGREFVVHGPAGYLLRTNADDIDAGRFRILVERARNTGDDESRAALFGQALRLWRGQPYVDFADEPFTQAAIARLEEARLTALEDEADARLALGDHGRLVGELVDLVHAHPLRERLGAALMLALYRSGRQGESLATFRELQRRLRTELGLDPGTAVARLHEAILRQDPQLDVNSSAPVRTVWAPLPNEPPTPRRTNLPSSLTDLVGRSQAIAEIMDVAAAERLVTLTGPGGVGKTHLAVEVASQLANRYPDGVWLVDLSPRSQRSASDTLPPWADVVDAVTETIGLPDVRPGAETKGASGPLTRLVAALDGSRTLLVLDNCEHLVDGVAEFAAAILRSTSGLGVLATSQETLGIPGEYVYSVPPLDVPDPAVASDPAELRKSSAAELFLRRAAAATPGFAIDADDAVAVANICRRLDGIPLALELAATRLRALGVHELSARLDDRFRVLTGAPRGVPARHQTLRATIDWSWNLLTRDEQAVLRRLAGHADGCTLEAAESTCAGAGVAASDVLALLTRLVDRSLVTVVMQDTDREPRYRLLESVATYCRERLNEAGESDIVAEGHARYYTALAGTLASRLRGREQLRSLRRLDAEAANLRRAFEHAVRTDAAHQALDLADNTAWYLYLRGRLREAERLLGTALRMPGVESVPRRLRARAGVWYCGVALATNAGADIVTPVEAALRPYEEIDAPRDLAWAQWFLSSILFTTGETEMSKDLAERAVQGARAVGDSWLLATTLSARSWVGAVHNDLDAMAEDSERSLELFRELDDPWGLVEAGEPAAVLAERRGEYERAADIHREGLRMAEDLGLGSQVSWKLSGLGRVTWLTGNRHLGRELQERALRVAREHSDAFGELYARIGFGVVARWSGDLDVAELYLRSAADSHAIRQMARPRAHVMKELGHIAELGGDAPTALARQLDGLDAARLTADPLLIAHALEGMAGAHVVGEQPASAAQLLGAAARIRRVASAPLSGPDQSDVHRAASAARGALGAAVFDAEHQRGADADLDVLLRDVGVPQPPLTQHQAARTR